MKKDDDNDNDDHTRKLCLVKSLRKTSEEESRRSRD